MCEVLSKTLATPVRLVAMDTVFMFDPPQLTLGLS